MTMNRAETNDGQRGDSLDAEHAQVAQLASKVTHLPEPTLPPALVERRRRESWLSRLLIAFVWLVTIGVGSIALLRIFYSRRSTRAHLAECIHAVRLLAGVCMPRHCIVEAALALAICNAAIIGCQVYWLAPTSFATAASMRRRRQSLPTRGVHSRANILCERAQLEHGARCAAARDRKGQPGCRCSGRVLLALARGVSHVAAHGRVSVRQRIEHETRIDSVSLFSKLPLKRNKSDWIANRYVESADIPLGSQTLRIVGLHAPRPMNFRDNDYDGYWRVVPCCSPRATSARGRRRLQCDAILSRLPTDQSRRTSFGARRPRSRICDILAKRQECGCRRFASIRRSYRPMSSAWGFRKGKGRGSDHKPLILDVEIRWPTLAKARDSQALQPIAVTAGLEVLVMTPDQRKYMAQMLFIDVNRN